MEFGPNDEKKATDGSFRNAAVRAGGMVAGLLARPGEPDRSMQPPRGVPSEH